MLAGNHNIFNILSEEQIYKKQHSQDSSKIKSQKKKKNKQEIH